MESTKHKKVQLGHVIIMAFLLLWLVLPFSANASNPTLVQINPTSKTVSAGQSFSLTVMCTPGQPIKSFELKVSFNPTYLQASSVSEGTIFNGYSTFFNDGTIDNNAGTIVDIYGLILGDGEVTGQGTFVTLSFSACLTSGTSSIGLYDVGVTNESSYVPILITNGSVTLREFTLNVTLDGSGTVTKAPNQGTYAYGTVVQLTASASTGWTFSSWSGNVTGSSNPVSITMTCNKTVVAHFTQNQYTLTVTIDGSGTVTKNPNSAQYTYGTVVTLSASPSVGWIFNSWTGDLTGSQNPKTITINGNKAVTAHFSDNAPPAISGITRVTSNPLDTNPSFGWVNVSCTATDNVAVSQVILRIHAPGGIWNNVSMTSIASGVYYYRSNTAFSSTGNYSYSFKAIDSSNNANISSQIVFAMPANWDINSDGSCTIFDLVLLSNHYGNTGSSGWIREDADNNGEISILDFVIVSNHYGETWWG